MEAVEKEEEQDQTEGVDPQKCLNSYAAVLANICSEYILFGHEAFDNNKFKQICIQHEGNILIARPIFKSMVHPGMNREREIHQT